MAALCVMHLSPEGTTGLYENELNTFPREIGLVVGGLGELNNNFVFNISMLAEIDAAAIQRSMITPYWQAAKSTFVAICATLPAHWLMCASRRCATESKV